jgi:hypothetical protein
MEQVATVALGRKLNEGLQLLQIQLKPLQTSGQDRKRDPVTVLVEFCQPLFKSQIHAGSQLNFGRPHKFPAQDTSAAGFEALARMFRLGPFEVKPEGTPVLTLLACLRFGRTLCVRRI